MVWWVLLNVFTIEARPNLPEVGQVRQGLERILGDNIMPFWSPKKLVRLGATDKGLIDQARTLWFYAYLCNAGYGTEAHLRAAEHGFYFLRDALKDDVFGGHLGAVKASDSVVNRPHKHLYGQSFALYGLSEYARASGEGEAVGLAEELFYPLEEKAHDATYGGYIEWFRRDWERGLQTGNYMVTEPDGKLMNTHLHLLEAFTTYWVVTGDELARERLLVDMT